MRIWRSFAQVPADLGRTVVVIGNFDGVHLGHQHVISRAREIADEADVRLVAVTFDPHPMAVLRPEHAPLALTDIDTRCLLLARAGADDVLLIPFSREIAAWSPTEFIERVLVETLHTREVVVGANFRFGSRASGDVATLTEAGPDHDFTVEGIPLDGGPQVWSSTYVRTCLAAGDVAGAAEALGRPYAVTGHVVRGDRRGRELGYPTANVPPHGLAAPADGVYAGWLRRLDEPGADALPAAISVGTNPTFDGERERRVEAYVLDRDDLELYDVPVEVSFVERLRGMVKFESVDALVATMKDDVDRARAILLPVTLLGAPAVAWVEQTCDARVREVEELVGGISSELFRLRLDSGADVVLRQMTKPTWRAIAGRLLKREYDVLGRLESTPVAAPVRLALDADGALSGEPSVLMTHLPGELRLTGWDGSRVPELAACLVGVHRSLPAPLDDEYTSRATDEPVVPEWSGDDGLYRDAFARVAAGAPAYRPSFIHRDYHLGNVLWTGSRVSGLVDWGFACSGPADLDVAHCGSNLASLYGADVAPHVTRAYVEQGGVLDDDPDAWTYWRLVDLLGYLPGPENDPRMARVWTSLGLAIDADTVRRRREDLLRIVLTG